MKKTILSIFASALALLAYGQEGTLPKDVELAFAKKFNSAQHLKWEKEEDVWEAEFIVNGTEMSASFDSKGNWLETETEVKKKDVPAEIFKAIILNFNGWEIEQIEQIEKPDYKGYEAELEKRQAEAEIIISNACDITIKKVKVEDED